MRNVETIHTSFSLKSFILYILTKTVRFGYIQFSQASITKNTTLTDKDFLSSLNFRHPFESGCLKFRLKDFPR